LSFKTFLSGTAKYSETIRWKKIEKKTEVGRIGKEK
jgi:hypothetical protein